MCGLQIFSKIVSLTVTPTVVYGLTAVEKFTQMSGNTRTAHIGIITASVSVLTSKHEERETRIIKNELPKFCGRVE
jgi:hypothetical protein